jgi:raffinose/stachyose/melibiose transport system permease protein
MTRPRGLARHAVLLFVVAFFGLPFYMVLVNGFKPKQLVVRQPLTPPTPETFTLDNFAKALNDPTISLAFAYAFSTLLAVVVVGLTIFLGSGLSYWVGRRDDRTGRLIYFGLLAGLMVPPQVLVIPVVKVLDALGLLFTVPGLVAYDIAVFLPFTTFVYVSFVRTIPHELDEAAACDGAGLLTTFWRVIFPLLRPATASLAVLLVVFVWNDFINPLVLLGGAGAYTVTTGIYRAVGIYSSDFGQVFAFIQLAGAPMLILFFAAQRYIVGGLSGGAVKG